jgi:hypothetical protein
MSLLVPLINLQLPSLLDLSALQSKPTKAPSNCTILVFWTSHAEPSLTTVFLQLDTLLTTGLSKTLGVNPGVKKDTSVFPVLLVVLLVNAESKCSHLTQLLVMHQDLPQAQAQPLNQAQAQDLHTRTQAHLDSVKVMKSPFKFKELKEATAPPSAAC